MNRTIASAQPPSSAGSLPPSSCLASLARRRAPPMTLSRSDDRSMPGCTRSRRPAARSVSCPDWGERPINPYPPSMLGRPFRRDRPLCSQATPSRIGTGTPLRAAAIWKRRVCGVDRGWAETRFVSGFAWRTRTLARRRARTAPVPLSTRVLYQPDTFAASSAHERGLRRTIEGTGTERILHRFSCGMVVGTCRR